MNAEANEFVHHGSMQLTAYEYAMLQGEHGPAKQEAIQFQIEVGTFFEARNFVPITHAHVMGDIEVMGDGGLDHLRSMSDQKAQCSVPTSSNAQCMHFHDDPRLRQDHDEIVKELEVKLANGEIEADDAQTVEAVEAVAVAETAGTAGTATPAGQPESR